MSETMKTVLQVLTAAAALVGALTGIYNTLQLAEVKGLASANQTAINAHLNSGQHD